MEEQLLKEYVATYLNPKYNRNWDVVNSKFPELSGVDKQLLKEYVSTYLNPTYKGDWNVVNSKFPELFVAEQPKKKEDTVSQSSAGGLVPPKSNVWTQDKEKDFSGLQVQVKDEKILNKEPREPKIGESRMMAASESTRVPNVRIPQKEQAPDEIDEKLQIIQEQEIDRKAEQQKSDKELETNPFVSFGKKFWETLSMQIPSAMEAKGAQRISNIAESDIRLLKSVANVPDDEIIEMPSLTDPRAGRTTKYKAGEYKKLITDKIAKGNNATSAALELAIKLNKDLENSDVISSLSQVKDGYDLVNFISSSVGQATAQIPLAVATGGGMSYAMESGNIYLETVKEIAKKEGITPIQVIQQGKDQVALAEIGGALSGALELFGAKKVLDIFGLENIKKDLRKKALTILVNSQIEGATEVGQEYVSSAAKGIGVEGELKTPTLTQSLDAYAAGMFGAAGIQSPALLFGSKKIAETKKEEEKKEEEKTEFKPGETVTLDTKTKTPKIQPVEEILEPVILDYGDSKFGFIRDESGDMELTKELDTEEQAISMAEMLGKTYKKLDFTIQEVDSTDPYTPTKYKIVAREKAPTQAEVSYTIDGSKMDRARFVAAVGEAKTEDALNELDTTDPDVQKIIDAKRAEITGQPVAEVEPSTQGEILEIERKSANKDTQIENISFNKEQTTVNDEGVFELAFEGSLLDNYDFLAQGTESRVYLSKDKSHVIKISEPYTSKDPNVYEKRVKTGLLKDILGDSGIEVVGYYDYNGTKNPIFRQNYVEGQAITESEAENYLRNNKNIVEIDNKFYTKYDGVLYRLSDFENNLIRDKEGKVVPIDLNISEVKDKNIIAKYDTEVDAIQPQAELQNQEKINEIEEKRKVALRNIVQIIGVEGTEYGAVAFDENGTNILSDIFNVAGKTEEEAVDKINAKYDADLAALKKPVTINVADQYTTDEVNRVKALPLDNEDGATMNLDGTKYEKGGLVIPLASRNLPLEELTPEKINEFVNENSESIGSDLVKVGIYKFPGRAEASIDINIVADRSKRKEALKIAKDLGQESIFDLDTFENIKTGATGKNPKVLTPKEFLEIQERLSEKPKKGAKGSRARLSSGVEQQDTRTQEEEIVREMDKLAEQSTEEAAFEEVQDAGKKDIGEAVAQNPTPNKKSFIKKALEFLGLSSENQLYRKIEDFANMPMMIGISDTLGSGVFKDALGNPMNVDGGLLFNLFRNPTLAWANVDKKYAENLVKQAKQVYTSNKELYDRLWKEGALPEGHIPYAIVRMGDDALYSNEAIFRYLSPWVKTLPLENRQAALEVLKKELETSAKDQTGISWIFELQDNIENGSIENFNGLLSYIKNLKENAKTETAISSITSLENQIKKLKGDEAFSDGIQIISEILDKKAPIAVLNFIEKNNITTVDQLFDAIAEDAVKRAKADPNNKSDLSLPLRAFISTKIFSTEPLTTGKPSSNFSKALLGKTENPLWADVDKLTLPYIKDQISEPAMIAARPGDIVAIMGIDVREESAGVAKANHNNYGFGPKGKLIGYLKEPARAFDVFAELKAKAPRLFKPNKSGVYPSPESVIRQAGGVAYVDVPFRGARLLTGGVTNLDLIIGNLRTAFPEVGVFTTEQEFDEFLKQEGIRSRKDQNGNTIYGITKDGKVFLNPDNKSLRTPIHEFAHIWVDYLRSKASGNRGKDLLSKGLQLVDGTPEYTEALEKYGERDLALEEALVELIATKGDTIINASQKSKFKNWLNALFKYIKEKFVSTKKLFDTKKTGDVEFKKFVENMTIDDFMNISLADLFGMNIVSRKFKPSDASTSAKARMSLGKLPARVESTILDKISEQEALGKKPIERAKEAIKYLKSTDAYNKLSERDKAKAIDGVKRLAGVRVKVLVDEVAALKDQIKQAEKLADAKNELPNYQKFLSDFTANIREMVRGGKISTFKAGVIIGRIANTNPFSQSSVNKTIDYIGEVFDSANLAMKISRAKALVKNAKRNIKSKIGQNTELFTAAKVLLSIDPHLIPTPLIDDYLNVMEVIGERAKVLSIKDTGEMAAKMNVIINAVIKEAEAKAKADEEANVKPKREPKAKPTPEESAKAAESIIKKIESEKLNTSKVLDKNANDVARKVASINRKDMTELLSTDKDGVVDYSKLNLLLGVRDNIKAGIITNEALNLVTTVEQNRGVDTFSKLLPKINGMSILNGVTRSLGEVKSLITSKSGVLQAIRSTGTPNIDDILGNFNDTTIYKLTFGKLSSAKGKLDATLSDRAAKASAAEILFQKGVGVGPVRFTSRTNNDVVKAKYKVQTLLLQKEFESNPGNESVAPAIDFINATIKAVTRKESSLTKHDAKILREIKTEFGAKDADGNETLNFKKMEDSLTANDKKAMKLIEEINASTAEEALFTSSVIRGNRVDILNNYVHHAVSDKGLMEQMVDLVNRLLEVGPGGKPSTKAGTLNERTPGAKAIIFDPVFSSMKGARETLTDFYMTPIIREVSGMLDKLENKVLDDDSTTEAQRDSVQAVKQAVREALEITFQNHFSEDTFGEAIIKGIQKLGYQSMLASIPRAGAELVSNMSYAVLSDPVTMAQSVKLADFAYSSDMLGFLENIGSSESTRLAGNEMLTSKYAEGGFAAGYGRTSKSGASSKAMNYASFIGDMTLGNVFRTNDVTADLVVSTPDKAISKPYYTQFFVNKFKELTGIELSKSDLRNIANGTSEYLSPEYENAIAKSREDADLAVIRMAGSTNSFNTILKNVPRKTDAPWTSAYRAINSLMARFYLTEYGTLRSAIIALFKTGQISRGAAVGLMVATVTRMSMYLIAFGLFKQLFDSAIANLFDLEEPEEEDEDFMTKVKRSIVGSGVNALTRRTLGNVPYIPIALGVELMNEELGEDYGLRDGEYDPFKNSLVFSKINTQDFYTKSPYEIFGKVISGPFSPIVSTAFRTGILYARATKEGSKPETKKRAMDELTQRMTMEAAGNAGLIPFYKDARRIMMNDFYARNYDKKGDSSFTITNKQIDLVRKSNPRAAERLESRKKSAKNKGKKERQYERTKSN